jgi:hypothetical protein
MNSKITYIIDESGQINKTWTSSYNPGLSVHWLSDSSILRTTNTGMLGGGVQRIAWNGMVQWEFQYHNPPQYSAHHEAIQLPNGNVLMIADERKTNPEAVQAGHDPSTLVFQLDPDYIIEVKPTGPTSGTIVWEWHVWDHLIQDFDPTKDNYGNVSQHPELLDINFMDDNDPMPFNWIHINSVDYNPSLNQILLSARNCNDIWIIDHSTTTQEAAGHTGGSYGHGGDFLYRWGNPQNYKRGDESNRQLFFQHYAKWIKPNCPGAGDILLFNNWVGGAAYSSVDEIVPPVNVNGTYYLPPGGVYGPTAPVWRYIVSPGSMHISSAERMPNGNTLICNGEQGLMFVVTPDGTYVWQYQYSEPHSLNYIFNADYIPPVTPPTHPNLDTTGSLNWNQVAPGSTVTGSFEVKNIGTGILNWTVNTSSIQWGTWTVTPSNGSTMHSEVVSVSVVVPDVEDGSFSGYLRVENVNNASDYSLVPVVCTTPLNQHMFPAHETSFKTHLWFRFFLLIRNLS